MRVSKFIKPHKDVLIEYIYDDGNNISEGYRILQNIRDNTLSYVAQDDSITGNERKNQLIMLDSVTQNFGLMDTSNYAFLQLRDYSSGFPVRHDIIKVHIPTNWTFGENLGFYLKLYAFNFTNETPYTLANFFFDATNVDQSYLLNYNAPPLYFQEKLWGKNITINVPSVYALARQRINNSARANTINANVTNGSGFSLTTPVFIDFQFIAAKRTINRVTTYTLTAKVPMTLPQAPDFENLGVHIQHSTIGDFFEIFGIFNGDVNQFDDFINNSFQFGNRYYVTYTITLFEQNIRGKTFTITVTDNFYEKIEYRPIIKYSTTTAIIDVEMNVIDAVDNTSIYRKASYGMLQDEVAKYSLRLTKINLANANKPKIYNIKSPEGAGIFGSRVPNKKLEDTKTQIVLEPIKINYAVLADRYNVVAKSDNVLVGNKNFYGIGKLELLLQPFDNIIQLKIASDVTAVANSNATSPVTNAQYMDLTNMGEIKFVIKDDKTSFETGLYFGSNEVNLGLGFVVFKIPGTKMNDIKKIADGGMNLFYVVSTTDSGTTVIYSGLFKIYDSVENVSNLRSKITEAQNSPESYVVLDTVSETGIANVRRRTVTNIVPPNAIKTSTLKATANTNQQQNNQANTNQSSNSTNSSVKSSIVIGKTVYTINTDSSLSINNYPFTSNNIKKVLNLPSTPINLTFKGESLYANGGLLERVDILYKKLVNEYIKGDLKASFEAVQKDFIEQQFPTSKQSVAQVNVEDTQKKANKIGSNMVGGLGNTTEKKKGKLKNL